MQIRKANGSEGIMGVEGFFSTFRLLLHIGIVVGVN